MRHNITGSEAFEDKVHLGPGPGLVRTDGSHGLVRQKWPMTNRKLGLALLGVGVLLAVVIFALVSRHIGH